MVCGIVRIEVLLCCCFFFKTVSCCSNPGLEFYGVFGMRSLSEVFGFCYFFTLFLFNWCIFTSTVRILRQTFRFSMFRLFKFLIICFGFSLKGATLSTNLKFVRCSPSALIPSKISPLLKIFSTTAGTLQVKLDLLVRLLCLWGFYLNHLNGSLL